MIEPSEVQKILESVGAVRQGHFVLKSGRHASVYVNKDALYPHITKTSVLCFQIAQNFMNNGVEVVIGPALGGIILSFEVARQLSKFLGREILTVYAEKQDDTLVIRRGYDKLVKGMPTLVVEDVLTTGGSAKRVVDLVKENNGIVVGVGALCNRGGITPETLGVPQLFSLLNVDMDTSEPDECPLCMQGVPINTDVGHGQEYLEKLGQAGV